MDWSIDESHILIEREIQKHEKRGDFLKATETARAANAEDRANTLDAIGNLLKKSW